MVRYCRWFVLAWCTTIFVACVSERVQSQNEGIRKVHEVDTLFTEVVRSPRVNTPEIRSRGDWINRNLIYGYSPEDRQNRPLIEYLMRQTRSSDEVVVIHAVFALATLKQTSVFPRLIQEMQSNPNGYVRGYAARALGMLGDKRAFPYLEKALHDSFTDDRQGDVFIPFVRDCARAALNDLRSTPNGPP